MAFEDKLGRQQALSDLLQNEECFNQQEVAKAMRKRGFAVTQPSISRDFQELGVVKIGGRYAIGPSPANYSANGVPSLVVHIEAVGTHLVVARTESGAANVIAAKIDDMGIKGLVGTVAGDDTIFLATKNKRAQQRVQQMLVTISV